VRVKELSEITGLGVRTIQFYTDKHLIAVENADIHTGRGCERTYGEEAIKECEMIMKLRSLGLTVMPIGNILRSTKSIDSKIRDITIATELLVGLMDVKGEENRG